MDAQSQRCGMCMHFRPCMWVCQRSCLGMCLVYGRHVLADEHHVNEMNAITGEDYGCEDFVTPEEDEEWCRALERAERHSVPWR